MKRIMVGSMIAGLALGAAALLLWPHAKVNAQVGPVLNAEGCTCSRPTTLGSGRDQLSNYYCTCPAMQCVITATAAGATVPPNVVQNCRDSR
jgi:hypothetical protein